MLEKQSSLKFTPFEDINPDSHSLSRLYSLVFLLVMYLIYLIFNNITSNLLTLVTWILIELVLLFNVFAFALNPSGVRVKNLSKKTSREALILEKKWSTQVLLPLEYSFKRVFTQSDKGYIVAAEDDVDGFLRNILIFYFEENNFEKMSPVFSDLGTYYKIILHNFELGLILIPFKHNNHSRILEDDKIHYISGREIGWQYELKALIKKLPQLPIIADIISDKKNSFLYLSTVNSEVFLEMGSLQIANRDHVLKQFKIELPTKFKYAPIRGIHQSAMFSDTLWFEIEGNSTDPGKKLRGLTTTTFLINKSGDIIQLGTGTFRLNVDRQLIQTDQGLFDMRLFVIPSASDPNPRILEILFQNSQDIHRTNSQTSQDTQNNENVRNFKKFKNILEVDSYNLGSLCYSESLGLIGISSVKYTFLMKLFLYHLFKKHRLQNFMLIDLKTYSCVIIPMQVHRNSFDCSWLENRLLIVSTNQITMYQIN